MGLQRGAGGSRALTSCLGPLDTAFLVSEQRCVVGSRASGRLLLARCCRRRPEELLPSAG